MPSWTNKIPRCFNQPKETLPNCLILFLSSNSNISPSKLGSAKTTKKTTKTSPSKNLNSQSHRLRGTSFLRQDYAKVTSKVYAAN